eukprot:3625942-Rhodomonas_salina.1
MILLPNPPVRSEPSNCVSKPMPPPSCVAVGRPEPHLERGARGDGARKPHPEGQGEDAPYLPHVHCLRRIKHHARARGAGALVARVARAGEGATIVRARRVCVAIVPTAGALVDVGAGKAISGIARVADAGEGPGRVSALRALGGAVVRTCGALVDVGA